MKAVKFATYFVARLISLSSMENMMQPLPGKENVWQSKEIRCFYEAYIYGAVVLYIQ